MNRVLDFWQKLKLKRKIATFIGAVLLVLCVAMLFNAWIVKLFFADLNHIMEDNRASSDVLSSLTQEQDQFQQYIRRPTRDNKELLEESMENTKRFLEMIPFQYSYLGEARYAKLFALKTSYQTYCQARNDLLNGEVKRLNYVEQLYELYEMQDYLRLYAREYSRLTLDEGSEKYKGYVPAMTIVPGVVIGVIFLFFLIILQLARMMSNAIAKPVVDLVYASREIAQNHFEVADVTTESKDELGELVTAFNKMKYATGEYISALEERREALDQLHLQEMENLEVEKRLEATKLELLKSQINPHFLFNTLNVIAGMANLEDAKTTEKMIGSLSSLFRYNLKNQEAVALLSLELKAAQDYMYLQQMRFGSRVEYQSNCMVDAEKVMIPAFTFQPILENAIIHGLSPKEEGGKINLDVFEQDGMLHLVVKDTGVGMNEEQLCEIREELETNIPSGKVGMGIGNIYKRVNTMYENGSMQIQSTKGIGTTIEICIPCDHN